MIRNRLFALALSGLLAAGLCGCHHHQPEKEPEASQSIQPESRDLHFDPASYKAKIEAMCDLWEQPGQDAQITAQIEEMVRAVDTVYADYARAEIAYYSDWNNEALRAKRSAAYEDLYIVSDMTNWAMVNGYHRSAYAALFAPYVTAEDTEYYLITALPRVMSGAKADATDSSQLLDDYYS
ncbi:MAG: hypothetical protein J5722_10955, partial [Oscillospiraceae bacterium]|nr:hypothetical protein [Oscillospiraceae bacterium]